MLPRNRDSLLLPFKWHIDYVDSVTKMTCKGICVRHKAQKPVGSGRYASGQKRCQICEIFMKWDGLWCPCCGYRLRTKPRNLKYKAKLRAKNKSIQSIHPPLIIR
jgi:hypothetical protein